MRRSILLAIAISVLAGMPALSKDLEVHVETASSSFSLMPGTGKTGWGQCKSGTLISGGYAIRALPGVVATANHMRPGFAGVEWRVDIHNLAPTHRAGELIVHTVCTGASVHPANSTVGTIYYKKYVHQALNRQGKVVDVFDIHRSDVSGANEERLTHSAPQKDHDSGFADASVLRQQMVFETMRHRDGTAARDKGEIYVSGLDGSAQTRLTDDTADDLGPRWCGATHDKIIWLRDEDIAEMNPDGSNMSVRATQEAELGVDCSPDGTQITYIQVQSSGLRQLFVANRDGSNPVALSGSVLLNQDPLWSPDGQLILFASDRGATPTGHYELYTVEPRDTDGDGVGDNLTQLTTSSASAGFSSGVWSPDATQIMAVQFDQHTPTIHLIDPSTLTVSPPLPFTPPDAFVSDWE